MFWKITPSTINVRRAGHSKTMMPFLKCFPIFKTARKYYATIFKDIDKHKSGINRTENLYYRTAVTAFLPVTGTYRYLSYF